MAPLTKVRHRIFRSTRSVPLGGLDAVPLLQFLADLSGRALQQLISLIAIGM